MPFQPVLSSRLQRTRTEEQSRFAPRSFAPPIQRPQRTDPAPPPALAARPVQRRVEILDSSKKGRKSKPTKAGPADVENWIFYNIGANESRMYPAGYEGLITLCDSETPTIALDSADAVKSFAELKNVLDPMVIEPETEHLDELDEGEQFDLIDRANHPERYGTKKKDSDTAFSSDVLTEWNRFLDSFDREWGNLTEEMIKAGREDHETLPRLVSAIRSRYEDRNPVYVGIGASAEVVIEFLRQSKSKQPTATIPISTVKWDAYENANGDEEANVNKYLARCLGKWWTQNVNLVLLDATEAGDTLEVLQNLINRHDEEVGLDREVITASLSATPTYPDRDTEETFKETDIEILKPVDHKVRELMRFRFFYQNVSGYKTIVGRMYGKVNTFAKILSGEITVPQGYNRKAHLKIIEFVQFVRSRDSKTPKVKKTDAPLYDSDSDSGEILFEDL